MDHFFAIKFCIYFSENPPNVLTNAIFLEQKTLQKVMKITHFDVLGGPFVDRDQASRREPKIMQNCVKMHLKSSQNERGKNVDSALAMVRNACRRWTCENASKRVHFVVPGVVCSRHG